MTARFLLDTNIVSDLVRHPQGRVADRIAELGEGAIATSIIVVAELRYGATKKDRSGWRPNSRQYLVSWRS